MPKSEKVDQKMRERNRRPLNNKTTHITEERAKPEDATGGQKHGQNMKKTCPNNEKKGGKVDQAMLENTCRNPSERYRKVMEIRCQSKQ